MAVACILSVHQVFRRQLEMDVQCVGVTFLDMFTRSHFFFFLVSSFLHFSSKKWLCCFKILWYLFTISLDFKCHCHLLNAFVRNAQISKSFWSVFWLNYLYLMNSSKTKGMGDNHYPSFVLVTLAKLQEPIGSKQLF